MKRFLQNAGRILTRPDLARAYSRWQWDRLRGTPNEVVMPHDLRVRGFRNFSEYWSFHAPAPAEQKLIERTAKSAKFIADVGANLGSFTLMLARLAPQATIFGFEPAPSTFQLLVENVRRNSLTNVSLQMKVVSDREGTIKFTDSAHGSGNNGLFRDSSVGNTPIVEVTSTTLDQFCRDNSIEWLDFLKIDTEGAEPLVLRGTTDLLRRRAVKMGLIEIAADCLQVAGSNQLALAEQIRKMGYCLYHLTDDGTPGPPMTDDQLRNTIDCNAVLMPIS